MTNEILNFINENTNAESLDTKNTKEVAAQFGIETKAAYKILKALDEKGLIQSQEAPNSDNFASRLWYALGETY